MKKYTLLTILSAAAVLASCNRVESLPQPQFGGDQFILSLDSGALVTKAGETNAPEFETKIDHFDFFFFDDAAGTQPTDGMHGRVSGASKQLNTGIGEAFEALRLGTHYVYILANYPDEIDHTNNWELEDILALPVSSKLLTSFDETGVATFCNYLVMDSYDEATGKYTTELTPTRIQEQRECVIGLSRIAAKLTLTLDIEEKVIGSDGTETETWKPIVRDIEAYYVNALNYNSTVSAKPVRRAELQTSTGDQYLTYPENYHMTKVTDYKYILDDVYTYPQTWQSEDNGEPYFKVYLPWISDLRGTSNFYYKVTVPRPEGSKWTINRNSWYNVEVKLSVVDAVDDYVEVTANYTVHPWSGSSVPGGTPLASARFFDVPTLQYHIYSDNSLEIPFYSDSQASAKIVSIEYTEFRNGTEYHYVHTPDNDTFSVKEPTTAASARTYSVVVDDALKTATFTHDISNLFLARTIVVRITKNSDPSQYKDVTIIQHPSIEFDIEDAKDAFVNGRFGHLIEPALAIDAAHSGQTFGRSITISSRDKNRLYQNSSSVYASYYANDAYSSGLSYIKKNDDIYATLYVTSSGTQVSHEMFLTKVAVNAFNGSNDTYKTYEVTNATSSTNARTASGEEKEYTFRLGDPRVKASTFNNATPLAPYLTFSTGSTSATTEYTQAWESPDDILITSTDADDDCNVISPWYMFSSNMNMVDTSPTFEGAIRRGETYQDSGYPAGRWRLPTEAEIAFVVARQAEHVSPVIFRWDQWYWTGNGSMILVPPEGSTDLVFRVWRLNETQKHQSFACPHRFVYDLWYWGNEPMTPTNRYYPNMHEH